jgi:hypothetical protein
MRSCHVVVVLVVVVRRFTISCRKEVRSQEAGIHIRVGAAVGFVEDILAFENFKGMMKVYAGLGRTLRRGIGRCALCSLEYRCDEQTIVVMLIVE